MAADEPLAAAQSAWIAARSADTAALAAAARDAQALPRTARPGAGSRAATPQLSGPALETLLVALPRLCPSPSRPRPGAWWRQVCCAATIAARLYRAEAHRSGLTAALAAAAPLMLAQALPDGYQRIILATDAQRPGSLPQWRALAHASAACRLGALAAGAARAWGVDKHVAEALVALDDDAALEADPLAAAAVVARWLLALKGMRAPFEAVEPEPSAATIRRLGLGAQGLAEAIADLSAATDDGRALCASALAIAARGAPRHARRARS